VALHRQIILQIKSVEMTLCFQRMKNIVHNLLTQKWNAACVQKLEEDVETHLTGRLQQVILGLLDNPLVYYAKELNRAIDVCYTALIFCE
jgi:hypothetical protein